MSEEKIEKIKREFKSKLLIGDLKKLNLPVGKLMALTNIDNLNFIDFIEIMKQLLNCLLVAGPPFTDKTPVEEIMDHKDKLDLTFLGKGST